MKKSIIFLSMLCCMTYMILSCSSSKIRNDKSAEGGIMKMQNYKGILELVNDKSFTIISDWANPLNGNQVNFYGNRFNLSNLLPPGSGGSRVNLIGNDNSITFKNDSVKGFLPYYGEVQVVKNYGGQNGGITFDALYDHYKVKKDPDNQQIILNFDVDDDSERFQISIKLYGDYLAHTTVSSAYRNTISYDGKIMPIKESNEPSKNKNEQTEQ